MLILHPEKPFSFREIYDVISQDKESDNPASAVNNADYRLRCNLEIIGLKELVLYTRGTYFLNPRFKIESDAERFLSFYNAIQNTDNPDKKLEQCHNAINLYRSHLPEALSSDIRWVLERSNFNIKFLNAAAECVNIHISRGEYSAAYDVAHNALAIEPNEPALMILMAKAMKKAGRPGVNAYVSSIMPYIEPFDRAQLKKILEENELDSKL